MDSDRGRKGGRGERIGQCEREEGKRGRELDSDRGRKGGREGENWTVTEGGKGEERKRNKNVERGKGEEREREERRKRRRE